MSDLDTSFTFRLTRDDKAALSDLAERMGCDRGAALRRIIRRASPHLAHQDAGHFAAHGHIFRLKLNAAERAE